MKLLVLLKVALRELQHGGGRLMLFAGCVVIGVSGLSALTTFRDSLVNEIALQAKELLGADLVVTARQPPTEQAVADLLSIKARLSRSLYLSTIAFFPSSNDSRLVQLRAADEEFPLYGKLLTEPEGVWSKVQSGEGVLADESLMLRHELKLGDRISIGGVEFPITGKLIRVPGEILGFGIIAPRIYISLKAIEKTQLTGVGSQVRYRFNYKLLPDQEEATLLAQAYPILRKHRLESDSALQRKDSIGKTIANIYSLLSLSALASLLLGGLGIALSSAVYFRARLRAATILRLLGVTPRQLQFIVSCQLLSVGVVSSALGVAAGLLIAGLFPVYFASFLPIALPIQVSLNGILRPMLFGITASVIFSLPALYQISSANPAAVFQTANSLGKGSPLVSTITAILILTFLYLASLSESASATRALYFVVGSMGAILLVVAVAKLVCLTARKVSDASLPFSIKYGLKNLFRPDNQSTALISVLGLGIGVLWSLLTVKHSLVREIDTLDSENQPNLIFFDIQPDQLNQAERRLKPYLRETTPIVSMRLYDIAGKKVSDQLEEISTQTPRWALKREYRSTFRDNLIDSEELLRGAWNNEITSAAVIPISVERGIAEDLGLDLGTELTFDIQGVFIRTKVANLRKVDWKQLKMNFFFVFPKGVLDDAPKTFAITTRTPSTNVSVELQRSISKELPNVSAIDLRLTLDSIKQVIEKLQAAAQFVATFFVACASLILASALIQSSTQRLGGVNLLRVLGAQRQTVIVSSLCEYLCLALVGCVAALVISSTASWLILYYQLEVRMSHPVVAIILSAGATVLFIVALGFLLGGAVYRMNPQELMKE